MFNDITWKKDDQNCISSAGKVKACAKKCNPGHWNFLGPGLETRWYGDSHYGQWDRTANRKIQQFKETGHPIFINTSAVSRGVFKRRNGKRSIHVNGQQDTDKSQDKRALSGTVFMRPKRIGATISFWQMDKKNESLSCGQWIIDQETQNKCKCWYLLRNLHLETRCIHSCVKKPSSSILWQPEIATTFDLMMTTDGGNLFFYAENIRILDLIQKLKHCVQLAARQLLDQSLKFILWKFLTSTG